MMCEIIATILIIIGLLGGVIAIIIGIAGTGVESFTWVAGWIFGGLISMIILFCVSYQVSRLSYKDFINSPAIITEKYVDHGSYHFILKHKITGDYYDYKVSLNEYEKYDVDSEYIVK